MNWQKNLILAAIGVVVWMLVVRWSGFQAQYESLPVANQQSQPAVEQLYTQSTPVDSTLPILVDEQPRLEQLLVDSQKVVTITTDVLKVTIETLGGDVVAAKLLNNLDKMKDEGGQPISIFTRANGNEFIAESGLIGIQEMDHAIN